MLIELSGTSRFMLSVKCSGNCEKENMSNFLKSVSSDFIHYFLKSHLFPRSFLRDTKIFLVGNLQIHSQCVFKVHSALCRADI